MRRTFVVVFALAASHVSSPSMKQACRIRQHTSRCTVLLLMMDWYMDLLVVLPIKFCQVSYDRIVLSGGDICTAGPEIPAASLSDTSGLASSACTAIASIHDIRPSRSSMRRRVWKDLDMRHQQELEV